MNSHPLKPRSAILGLGLAFTLALTACGSEDEQAAEAPKQEAPDLTSAPENAQWNSMNGIQVPNSADCDSSTVDGVRVGYAQTPQCGVIAAINGQVALATTPDKAWPNMANVILAPGKGKDQWVQARAYQSIQGTVEDPARFVGFKISEYTDEGMVVVLATEWPDGKITAQATQLAWQGGDWKLVLPTQDEAPDAIELENLDGLTPFAAKG